MGKLTATTPNEMIFLTWIRSFIYSFSFLWMARKNKKGHCTVSSSSPSFSSCSRRARKFWWKQQRYEVRLKCSTIWLNIVTGAQHIYTFLVNWGGGGASSNGQHGHLVHTLQCFKYQWTSATCYISLRCRAFLIYHIVSRDFILTRDRS